VGRIIGIDLGTTNSVVATIDMGGVKVLQNRENEQQTKSVVSYHKGEFIVGTPAFRRWLLNPSETIISIKRLIGRGIGDPEIENINNKSNKKSWLQYKIVKPTDGTKDGIRVILGEKEYSPVEISSKILKKIKDDAEFILGEEVTHAVITVPAYFSDKQRNATREAGLLAGLTVMKIIDEPTAAAIAFGIDFKDQEAKTLLVFDLGGGTFDISVLMMAAGAFSPLNLEGDMWLGGDDFDSLIIDYVLNEIKNKYNIDPRKNSRFMATLKNESQKAKEALSSSQQTEIIIPSLLNDEKGNIIDVEIEITRDQFNEMMSPLLERIEKLVKKAVKNANFEFEDIDYILMAGNATAIPKIHELIEKMFGKERVMRKLHPKQSVAIGAAMAAAVYGAISCPRCGNNNPMDAETCEKCGEKISGEKDIKFCPSCGAKNSLDADFCVSCENPFIQVSGVRGGIAPFNYGIQTENDKFNVFIKKGDPFETPEENRKVLTFYTRFPNQRIISVPVYGGDNMEKATANEKQGEVFSVLPPGFPEGTPIKVKMWLDNDGSFIVDNFLDDGTDIEDLILRGESDQKAVETLEKAEEQFAKKVNSIPQGKREEIEKKRDSILEKMDKKDFSGALDNAKELLSDIEKSDINNLSLIEQAYNVKNYLNFILTEYNWIIGPNESLLRDIMKTLDDAIYSEQSEKLKSALEKANIELNKIMKTTDLGAFLSLHGAIITVINPIDPALGNQLQSELKAIENLFKNKSMDANNKLTQFIGKLNSAISDIQKRRPNGKPCPNCGTLNPVGVRYCSSCNSDLWILGAK